MVVMERREYVFKTVGITSIAADVYFTKGDDRAAIPIALYFHGGNFTVGSKELLPVNHIQKLLELGFIVVSANYRLCPTINVYDGPVTDALDAYVWAQTTLPGLLKKDADLHADGARIVTFGHSCGATLALLTGGEPNPPLAILDMFGMKFLRDPFYHTPPAVLSKLPHLDEDFVNQVHKEVPPPSSGPAPVGPKGPDLSNARVAWMFKMMKEGTHMQTVVSDGDFNRIDPAYLFSRDKFPPTYFIHGTADMLVDAKFSQQAHNEILAAGKESVLVLVNDAGHGFDAGARPGNEAFEVVSKGFEFLKAHI